MAAEDLPIAPLDPTEPIESSATEHTSGEATAEQLATPEPPATITAFDQNGQPVQVEREEWRTNVIPNMLTQARDIPEQLYMLIINSLNDGFFDEMVEPAEHLYKTDDVPARGASMYGIVLIQQGRLDEAEQVLEGYLKQHGEDATVLINLAKVFASRGDNERADATLWRGLELDPNQENGLSWYGAIAQEKGGDDGARIALERVQKLDNSWRAQLWLARAELVQQNFGRAFELYNEAIERAPKPLPGDLLMQMSGDLGLAGRLVELMQFTAPHFIPELHGMAVGANLIKASIDLGNLQDAARITSALGQFNRPDWAQALAFWNQQISGRLASAQGPGEGLQIGMLRVDGPIWLPPVSPARPLFGSKDPGPSVTFLGGSAETPQPEGEAADPNAPQQPPPVSDALARMTRALPLYLAEQVEMRTAAHGRALIPWAVVNQPMPEGQPTPSGFIVSNQRWPDETARAAVQDPANASDYVVTVHVDAEVEPWEASLHFIRTSDGTRIGELQADFSVENPEDALPKLADEVVHLLRVLGGAPTPVPYKVPQGELFGSYLLRLEQLLAIRCASMPGVPPQFLNGEREILEGNLMLCEAQPTNIPTRILLVETMGALARIRPQAVAAVEQPYIQLQQQYPLPALDFILSAAQSQA